MNAARTITLTSYLLALIAIACALVPAAGGASVTTGTPPAFVSATAATFVVGSPGAFTFDATGSPTPALSVASGSLPNGLSFTDNGDGTATISGAPWHYQGGIVPLTLRASNTAGSVTQSFQLTIDEAPTFGNDPGATFQAGVPGAVAIWAGVGYPTATTFSVSSGSLPSWLSWLTDATGHHELAGTPPAGSGGIYTFTLEASNGISPDDVVPFALTVEEGVAFTSSPTATFTTGTPESYAITTAHHYPTAATIALAGGTVPAGLELTDNGDGTASIAGTPAAGTAGTYYLALVGGNGVVGGDVEQLLILTVLAGPTSPLPDPTSPDTATPSPVPGSTSGPSAAAGSVPPTPTAVTSHAAPVAAAAVLARFTFTHLLGKRTVRVASFVVSAARSRNRVAFDALARGRRLVPGRYTLSALVVGRNVHGSCVAATHTNRGAHPCRRLTTVAAFTVEASASHGWTRLGTLAIEGRKLVPGLYVLAVHPIDGGATETLDTRQLTLAVGA
jgi:hypothetical protein